MLRGESHVSRDPILLLGNIIYAPCHVSLNVRIKAQYNSSYCELGGPVACGGVMLQRVGIEKNVNRHFSPNV